MARRTKVTYYGKVKGGVIVLADGVQLPEGTSVEVTAVTTPKKALQGEEELDPIFRIAELAVDTGIPDLATNIDHYLYGHPKVTDGK
jgi:hypothetical protein